MNYLESEEALTRFLIAFENGTYPAAQWKHAEHLALAACYLYAMPMEAATDRARDRIRAYNEAQGGQNTEDAGYHETLTVFWLTLIDDALDRSLPRAAAARAIVERFASRRDIFCEYYSFDVLKSHEARARWIPPDR